MRGKLITIEGCEGSGKSTVIAQLSKYYKDKNAKVVFTREPGGTKLAEAIRSIILSNHDEKMSDMTELLLYTAARAQHVFGLIEPSLQGGQSVICDRFVDSTCAYQGHARGLSVDYIETLNQMALNNTIIDCTIWLDITPELAFARKGGFDPSDRIECEKIDFHNRVYQGYQAIASLEPNRVKRVDASQNAARVFEDVLDICSKMIKCV